MNRFILLLLPAVLLFIQSCTKDELTLPTTVDFKFELVPHDEGSGLKSGPPFDLPFGRMTVNRGSLVISSIEFEGRRDEGRDVFFISDFPEPVTVNLETGETSREISFDIPQGVYNRVEIYIELGGETGIPLSLEGTIKKGQDEKVPLRFEYNIRERIGIRAEPGRNRNRIVLRRDAPSTAKVEVNAGTVFQFVNFQAMQVDPESLMGADGVVLISAESNIGVFSAMAPRIDKAFSIVFD